MSDPNRERTQSDIRELENTIGREKRQVADLTAGLEGTTISASAQQSRRTEIRNLERDIQLNKDRIAQLRRSL